MGIFIQRTVERAMASPTPHETDVRFPHVLRRTPIAHRNTRWLDSPMSAAAHGARRQRNASTTHGTGGAIVLEAVDLFPFAAHINRLLPAKVAPVSEQKGHVRHKQLLNRRTERANRVQNVQSRADLDESVSKQTHTKLSTAPHARNWLHTDGPKRDNSTPLEKDRPFAELNTSLLAASDSMQAQMRPTLASYPPKRAKSIPLVLENTRSSRKRHVVAAAADQTLQQPLNGLKEQAIAPRARNWPHKSPSQTNRSHFSLSASGLPSCRVRRRAVERKQGPAATNAEENQHHPAAFTACANRAHNTTLHL